MRQDEYTSTIRVVRDVLHQANLEEKRLKQAKINFFFNSILVVLLLAVDYMAGRIMFTYLDPTLGDVSLGPEFLALTIPIAVIVIHLRIADDSGDALEHRLRQLAGFGVIVFLFGIATMISLVYLDASSGIGSSDNSAQIQGLIGSEEVGVNAGDHSSAPFSFFRMVLSSLSPIVFFAGMTLILFVTAYACHRLMLKMAEHYAFFSGASRRAGVLKRGLREIEQLGIEIRKQEVAITRMRKKLPADPEYRFAQIASAAICDALHKMKQALRTFGNSDELVLGVFERKGHIPPHIETAEEGANIIAHIRQSTTPYAILKNLGGWPPREEENNS